jgi:hypothetical protein
MAVAADVEDEVAAGATAMVAAQDIDHTNPTPRW